MTRRGDKINYGPLAQRDTAELISLIGDDLALGTTILPGTYTPTLTNVANISASIASLCMYLRIGTLVLVAGSADVDPIAGATSTQLGISLPIASNLAAVTDCSGTAAANQLAGQCAGIFADATNDRAEMRWLSADTTSNAMRFLFMYRIL